MHFLNKMFANYFQRMKTITVILFFMIGHTYSKFIKEDIIRCYVCNSAIISDNPKVSELHNTFPNYNIKNIPICGSNVAVNFTLNCPEGYRGCLTKTDGKITLKSCNKYSITDCKIANNMKYCFCIGDLCNNATISNPSPTDDEDLDQLSEDGSGLFDDWTSLDKHKFIEKKIYTTVIFNDRPLKNNSFTKSSAPKIFLPNILSIIILIIANNELNK